MTKSLQSMTFLMDNLCESADGTNDSMKKTDSGRTAPITTPDAQWQYDPIRFGMELVLESAAGDPVFAIQVLEAVYTDLNEAWDCMQAASETGDWLAFRAAFRKFSGDLVVLQINVLDEECLQLVSESESTEIERIAGKKWDWLRLIWQQLSRQLELAIAETAVAAA